ncbi:MAG: pyridoxal 5'-phosphate synthase glutaminase subunit PdxT [Acidimicrobiia bacterium]|nr:pyridoxal 5'-phosphate synthase glutaminase subunit PdxT [Acidimicrobiia bacterium]
MLEAVGARVREIRQPAHLDGLDGLVLPGGESTTMALLLDRCGIRQPLQDALADGLPTFGTCAGMILLAREILDGRGDQWSFETVDVSVRRNGYGRQSASFETSLVVDGLDGGPFPGVFIRAPLIEAHGPAVRPLATLDGVPVLCEQGPFLLAAFHPELSGDLRLHARWVASLDRPTERLVVPEPTGAE